MGCKNDVRFVCDFFSVESQNENSFYLYNFYFLNIDQSIYLHKTFSYVWNFLKIDPLSIISRCQEN